MTPLPPERSLPLRTPIRDGESLDSWVEATARRHNMSARRLLTAFGLHPRELPGQQLHALVLGLPAPVLRRMERQAGLPDGRLDAAVADRHTALGWEMLRGSRYCPRCLSEHNGRWQLRWRLPWVFACTRHRLLMPDRCPGCARLPRRRLSQPTGLNPPGTCPNLIRRGQVCGTDLSTTPHQRLPANDRRLAAQQWLDHRLTNLDNGDPAAVTDLLDLQAVATWIRSRTTPRDFEPYGPAAVAAFNRHRTQRRDGRRPEQHAFTDPLLVAAVATHAVTLIRAETPATILPLLTPLLGRTGHTPMNKRGSTQPMQINANRWQTLSSGLCRRLLHAADPQLAPLDRLRLRTVTTNPRLPDPAATPAAQRAMQRVRWVPQMLWPEWAVRLLPIRGVHLDTLRAAISAALLVPGHPERRLTTFAADLHASTATTTLRRLMQHGSGVLELICRLAEHLDTHGAPIDYQRRRTVISTDLLDQDQWWQVCFEAHAHPGEDRRHLDACRYLYQLLTGADLTSPAAGPLRLTTASDRNVYIAFTTTMTSPLRRRLRRHAVAHLRDLGIREPVTWAPPGHLTNGLKLPGRDPDDIDMDTVRVMIVKQQQTFQVVAHTLGTTVDHVRLAAERVHRPVRRWGRNATPSYWRTKQRAQRLLTAEFFQREYVHAGKTLTQIAEQTGLHRTMLAEYARAAGIRLANATEREPTPIDPDWLRHQYITLGRSFTDIGAELGLTGMTVNRAAHRFGISIRPSGVISHPQMTTRVDTRFPLDIRCAVEGVRHGWLRLHRFQQALAYPSLNTAAEHLNIRLPALVHQIQRLEADIGAQLLHRATPAQPMRPTARGAALLDALTQPHVQTLLHQHAKPLPGWKPDDHRRAAATPAARPAEVQTTDRPANCRRPTRQRPTAPPDQTTHQEPDLLRRATQQRRSGWARLQRFATTMTYPTLTEAAEALGINISTLIEQLNRLEHDVGETLFHRATPDSRIQRPTRRGAALLRALARADTQPSDRNSPTAAVTMTTTLTGLPRDLLRAVQGQRSGWTRLERFAATMAHPTITDAATALGIERTTLLEQLHRLETDIGANLYRRATAQGQAHQPTPRGAKLLNILAQPDIQDLRTVRARLPRIS